MSKVPMVSLPIAVSIAVGTLLLGIIGGAVAQGKSQLSIMKNIVPTDARKIDGRIYVPIADVAKAMGWKLSVSGNTISLQPPLALTTKNGNTSLLPKPRAGGLGEEVSADNCLFQVTKISEATAYERKFTNGIALGGNIAVGAKEKLVVLDCVLTNTGPEREEFCFSRDRFAENTVLLDNSGESLPPFAIDVAADEINPPGAYALSGANVRFALVFRVPETWQPKALVYTIVRYRARGMKKGTDVRVNL